MNDYNFKTDMILFPFRYKLTWLFSIVCVCVSCKAFKKTAEVSNPVASTSSKIPKIDTVITDIYDTIPRNANFEKGYVRKEETVKMFQPYFISDICQPGDTRHPLYVNYMKAGREAIADAKQQFIARLEHDAYGKKWISDQLGGDLTKLPHCTLELFPKYYLTPNIAAYNNEPNVIQYYHLDTSSIHFGLVYDKHLISFIKYKNERSYLAFNGRWDSLSYEKVNSLHKSPIIINNDICFTPVSFGNPCFGYVQEGHVMLAFCSKGNLIKRTLVIDGPPSNELDREIYLNECETILAEAFLTKQSGYSFLNQKVNAAKQFIVDYKPAKPESKKGN